MSNATQYAAWQAPTPAREDARSFQGALLAIAIGVLGATVVAVALAASAFSLFMGYSELSRRADAAMRGLTMEMARTADRPTDRSRLLGSLRLDPDIESAELVARDGRVLADYEKSPVEPQPDTAPQTTASWSADRVTASGIIPSASGPSTLTLAYSTAAPRLRAMRQLAIFLLSGTVGLVVIAMILHTVIKRYLRPWRALVGSMMALVNDDLAHPVHGLGSTGEIGALAAAVNVFKTKLIDREALRRQSEASQVNAADLHAKIEARVHLFRNAIHAALTEGVGPQRPDERFGRQPAEHRIADQRTRGERRRRDP